MNAGRLPPDRNKNDTALFDTLYSAHHRVVYAYLLGHVVSPDTAADLLQETFLRVWRHREDARQVPCERRRFWLFAIARNLLLDYRRRQNARLRCEETLLNCTPPPPCEGDPIHALIARETAATVDAAIAGLPDDLRLVLTLHLIGDMTSAEIGKHLHRPAGTVRYQIAKARQRIAQELKRNSESTDAEERQVR